MEKRSYGWIRSLPDIRNLKMRIPHTTSVAPLPRSVDLAALNPEIYDQGQTSSCTAHAITTAMRIVMKKSNLKDIKPSRMFIYWNERNIEGDVSRDSGAMIHTGMNVVAKYGAAPETEWDFRPSNMFQRPPDQAFKDAVQNMVHIYFCIDQVEHDFKSCLAHGFPFVLGISLYSSFETNEVAQSGMVPMPDARERMLGGHAVCCVGYDDDKGCFKITNSWGPGWGQAGYFWVPYEYVCHPMLADDFWTIRTMETQNDPNRKWVAP